MPEVFVLTSTAFGLTGDTAFVQKESIGYGQSVGWVREM